jgi:MFS family permease
LIDFKLYAPVAILYYSQVTGSYALGMSVFSIVMVTQAILELPTGIFSDLVGRARTVTLGSVALLLGTVCYAIGGSYGWLVVGALLEGLSRAFFSGNNDALLHDTLTDLGKADDYADRLGKLSSLFQAALAVSAILGGVIAHWSFAWVMWVSVLPQVVGLLVSLRLTEPKTHTIGEENPWAHLREAARLFWTNSRLRWLALASTLGTSAGEAIYLFNATFIASIWPVWAIGVQKALANGGAMVSFLTAGKLIKKYKELPVLLWSRVFGRVTSVIAYGWPTGFSPILLASHSLLYGSITVADNTLQQKEFSTKQRATMGSLISLGHSLGTGVMTVLVGGLGDWLGPIPALLWMQVFQAIPLVIYWFLWRRGIRRG